MAARAMPHDDSESPPNADGGGQSLSSDPLQRLEAELGEADGGQSGDERLYEEAQGLVEEAWSVLAECLSIREGLLDACGEIEQAMSDMQRRLGAIAVATEPDGSEPSSSGGRTLTSSSNGALGR
jgi:hypothetical protein